MKNFFTTILTLLAFFIAAPALANSFESFDQQITVREDSILLIEETVQVTFDEPRHGIYRDIPVRYQTEAGNPFSLRIKVVSVIFKTAHDNGAFKASGPVPYTTSKVGDRLRIKIGDPDVTVMGAQTYVITYEVSRALLFMSDHDELYWNVMIEPWGDLGFPSRVTTTVTLPEGVKTLHTRCFDSEADMGTEPCGTVSENSVRFVSGATGDVQSTFLTIVVGWPKGVVHTPAFTTLIKDWLRDNWIIFYPLIVFVFLFRRWWTRGREPKQNNALVVQYDPPENATPAEVGVLFDQKADQQDVTATIVHLAVRGYLVIVETEKKKLLGTRTAYSFELKKLYDGDTTLTSYERDILNGIFLIPRVGSITELSSLENRFYRVLPSVKKEMNAATVTRGWFKHGPDQVRAVYIGVGIMYLVIAWFFLGDVIAAITGGGPTAFIATILPGAFIILFGWAMPARTRAGADAYHHALGFKEYLSKAEKYKLQWEEKEHIFEKYLPYAMVFGVVDKWAKTFEGIAKEAPDWYRGSGLHMWSAIYFANSLSSATLAIGHSIATAPSSRGGGGFGGGGGGGGGFGGGGGGSW